MSKVIKGGTVCTADRTWKSDVLIEGEIINKLGKILKEMNILMQREHL